MVPCTNFLKLLTIPFFSLISYERKFYDKFTLPRADYSACFSQRLTHILTTLHIIKPNRVAIANKCLSLRHFPKQGKVAHVVTIRKPGKEDYIHPKSCRSIGLLSDLGKTVEKLLVNRLQYHVVPTLNERQYGFVPRCRTEDAFCDLMTYLRE
ncbi:Putative 115 kDa protein in type-1 retrotransposable element R1DM [Eumeta japonica]|uniref:115 kDa protein in type-1 retrotransposable element R1DM n=1 Tax=Eumeta variegata TaxID=151549 RepID=A0A4C1XUJ7_EUMVA|nr:Putative 115 kDa protein in type-1 retrotransposable element R1DM [Eumeta japonica]